MIRSLLLAASVLVAPGAALAQAPAELAAYDATRAATLAERLVLCDQARLLSSRPDKHATRAFVRTDGDRFELALPPDFVRASGWYDYDLERAFLRYRARGLVTTRDVDAVRDARPTPELRRFGGRGVQSDRFFTAQNRFCKGVIKAAYGR